MKNYAARPLTLALSLVLLALPLGTSAFAQSTPTTAVTGPNTPPKSVTGTDPEPQGGVVKTVLVLIGLA
jgi:hypothetical protein